MNIIPIGERINGIRIIGRAIDYDPHIKNREQVKQTMFYCECLCGEIILRESEHIIAASIYPCAQCRKKYNIKIDNNN